MQKGTLLLSLNIDIKGILQAYGISVSGAESVGEGRRSNTLAKIKGLYFTGNEAVRPGPGKIQCSCS